MEFGLILSAIPLAISIFVLVAFFQIRDYAKETAANTAAIHKLMLQLQKQPSSNENSSNAEEPITND